MVPYYMQIYKDVYHVDCAIHIEMCPTLVPEF